MDYLPVRIRRKAVIGGQLYQRLIFSFLAPEAQQWKSQAQELLEFGPVIGNIFPPHVHRGLKQLGLKVQRFV